MSRRGGSKSGWLIAGIVIGLALIISGAFCGAAWYKRAHTASYVAGTIDITNQFYQEEFNYPGGAVVLSLDANIPDSYIYEERNLPQVPFDGILNEYQLVFNNYYIYDVVYDAGAVYAEIFIDFYDTGNQALAATSFALEIQFLSNHTEMVLSTTGKTNADYLNHYFEDNNCRILIQKIVGGLA